jgi:hypothetical protein
VLGESNFGPGVHGQSVGPPRGLLGIAADGVLGEGKNGVHGRSTLASGAGVFGEHTGHGPGVTGSSLSGEGVSGSSQNGVGVLGRGSPAGRFEGDVEITGLISSPVIDNIQTQISQLDNRITFTQQDLRDDIESLNERLIAVEKLQQKADQQQPVVTPSPPPVLEEVQQTPPNSGTNLFSIRGKNFVPNASVQVRVVDEIGSLVQKIDEQTADSSGNLSIFVSVGIPVGSPSLRLYFAVSDKRPSASDWTGMIWSNTIGINWP